MDKEQLVWDHFKFNAEQRLKGFNFFVLLSIFADGGVFTALEKNVNPRLVILLGLFIVLLSVVFWLVDSRSRQLISLTIPALKEMESSSPKSFQLFTIDAAQQGSFVRYTFAIRAMLCVQFIFGFGVALYGYCPW